MARILITSALPYINGIKHLGNLAGSMLPADVYARFKRLQGHEVLYICATDEHGTPAELAAQKDGVPVQAYCDEQHEIQRAAGEGFTLSYDHFGRSSSSQNAALTQHFAHVLEERGLLEERTEKQVYSIDDGRFLPDRYVEGTCPHCDFEKARGDQCDNCGRLLDPIELKNPYSAVSGSTNIEIRDTTHLYLLQSKMQDDIRGWVEASTEWPQLAKSIALKWLDEGLQDRAITRDLSWGIPVAYEGKVREGFEDKVFYVWFDAPIEYIGATQEYSEKLEKPEEWERWWRTDKGAEDVTYVQFMGKDNVAFHTVSFPVTMIGSREPWKLVDRLKAFNWVTWYGGKFSTSMNRGVFMDQALELLPADYWRWYLMANAPEGSDAAFTWEGFQAAVNSDLANVLGNFVNRITKYCKSKFDGQLPAAGAPGEDEAWMEAELKTRLKTLMLHYEEMEFRKAAAETRAIWAAGNEYLTRAEPWVKYKNDVDAAAVGVRTGLNLVALFGILAQPFIPTAAAKILDALGIPEENRKMPNPDDENLLDALPHGLEISPPDVLFSKIEDAQVAEWTERFGGGQ
ncbi:methionine--tRNA ligase [Ponticaulis sp.]|uniref:methionine--tRNA ligase n=1 Tax=Ponticaulis sp. TaxID=2020902 RepID=UPI000B62EE09|nr:methionine--tRNA ligase [Ponticaulis sp.]MAJ09781.1 methionine--tRNA ligase [Ponticaulis sp.]RPG17118.1 MAG: methionine--tRNA ligase [Hyphomonadaceae bacterium TMED125]HBH90460.1 methionine--tRNA ligase [Hyphomonadaceae bacterium]|tara:strand:- start:149 stop:1864 length:1716 start_codon:yes stop_codon:yes gene_type:complete